MNKNFAITGLPENYPVSIPFESAIKIPALENGPAKTALFSAVRRITNRRTT